MFLYILEPL